jgi:hypothetical protein
VLQATSALQDLVLIWGEDPELRPVSALGDAIGETVSRLGPSLATLLRPRGPARVRQILTALDLSPSGDIETDLGQLADRLADPSFVADLVGRGPGKVATVLDAIAGAGGRWDEDAARGAELRWLRGRGLVVAESPGRLVLPREVSMALRGGHTTEHPVDEPPEVATVERARTLVDRSGAAAAAEFVRHLELLLEHWGSTPPKALRAGGLGIREVRAAAELLHVAPEEAALIIEAAHAAELVTDSYDGDDRLWMPTEAFDVWLDRSVAERWALVVGAWLRSDRVFGLTSRASADHRLNVLAGDAERPWIAATRRQVLECLAGLPEDRALASGTGIPSLVQLVRWQRPRRPTLRSQAAAWAVAEAAALGIVGAGALTAPGRALIESPAEVAKTLDPLLPVPVDHILLQADLTAVAPGPLEPTLARGLGLLADIESRGGATVYRFTESSLRGGYDAGWSAGDIHEFLTNASRTEVPQPLTYLVDDVARRFGSVRVGVASTFIRSDDEHALIELLHQPWAAALRLHRIAPTVLVSQSPADVVLSRLRDSGTAPVAEGSDGSIRLIRPTALRAPSPRKPARRAQALEDARRTAQAAATVNTIRVGDRAEATRPRSAAATSPDRIIAVLREAAESKSSVWLDYLDRDGAMTQRLVDPVRVEGGWLAAHDERADEPRRFALHRIQAVHPER